MIDHGTRDTEDRLSRRQEAGSDLSHQTIEGAPQTHLEAPGYTTTLLHDPNLSRGINGSVRSQVLTDAQRTHGNRAVQRCVQRQVSPESEPVPVQRSVDEQIADVLGAISDPLGLAISGVETAAEFAQMGQILRPLGGYAGTGSTLINYLGKADSLADMAGGTVQGASTAGRTVSALGTAANVLGAGLGLHKMATADSGFDVFEGGADTAASLIGFAGPLGRAFSAGYSGGRLLDQASGYVGDKLSKTEVGESLGMNPGGDYSLSSLLGKGLFAADKGISSLLPGYDESLEYNPETDDPSKVDRSYENTLSWKINQVLDGETNYTGEAYDAAKETITENYHEMAAGAGEMYNDASEYVDEGIETVKEYIPDIELPDVEYNPMNWF